MKEVKVPGGEIYVQSRFLHFFSTAVVRDACDDVKEPPRRVVTIPRRANARLSRLATQVDYDEKPILFAFPGPGDDVPETRVVGPACRFAQSPFAVMKNGTSRDL